ncbi:hypothetical protein [Pseudomonas sp. PA27(2017)]|uniref:hypothetical protein n=1 Tax=Pseudomonas sp. PA27(2017) TaxID=1932112 RepID=UPI0009684097|nr:hypothetical protein [Pseudomonas sp. PA27(2017)]OLU35454.1 hypothetical protein BVH06_03595 [Pseudomonas sp. PA27(2017)]
MVIAASAFAVINQPITAQKISRDTGLDMRLVVDWVTHAKSYEDGSGYQVFFKSDTPEGVREQIPRLAPSNLLIVLAA